MAAMRLLALLYVPSMHVDRRVTFDDEYDGGRNIATAPEDKAWRSWEGYAGVLL